MDQHCQESVEGHGRVNDDLQWPDFGHHLSLVAGDALHWDREQEEEQESSMPGAEMSSVWDELNQSEIRCWN